MEQIVVKKDLIKITNDFILGVILNEIVEIANEFRKEFIENKWHCPEFFEMDLLKIDSDNMLNTSKSSMRRYIKKLENLGFISIDKLEKKHKYRVNFDTINKALEKIGGELVVKAKKLEDYNKIVSADINTINNKNTKNTGIIKGILEKTKDKSSNIEDEVVKIEEEKNEVSEMAEQLKCRLEYHIIDEMRSNTDGKSKYFVSMFDSIYTIMLEVLTTNSKYININKQERHMSVVKSVFSKITFLDIQDIIYSMQKVNTKITNFRSYIITSIYNQYVEKDFRLQNLLYRNEGINLV